MHNLPHHNYPYDAEQQRDFSQKFVEKCVK